MVVHVVVSKALMLQIVPLAYVTMVIHVVVSKALMLQIAPLATLETTTCTTIVT
jgi:hypothetical protein